MSPWQHMTRIGAFGATLATLSALQAEQGLINSVSKPNGTTPATPFDEGQMGDTFEVIFMSICLYRGWFED